MILNTSRKYQQKFDDVNEINSESRMTTKSCYRCKSDKLISKRDRAAFHILLWSGLLLSPLVIGLLLLFIIIFYHRRHIAVSVVHKL